MARRTRFEDQLLTIHALREDPRAPGAEAALRRAMNDGSGPVVASAATIIGDAALDELYPLLAPAFERLVAGGAEADKGCRAKFAIADALVRNEVEAADVFLTGITLVQREPVWGGSVDTAASLRGTCGLGLAMLDHPDAPDLLAGLLADPEAKARAFAGAALGNLGRVESVPLLRFKCLVGDEAGEVLQECFASLLSLRWSASLTFVAGFLDARVDTTAEAALLALGTAKRDEVFPVLRDFADRARPALLRSALLAVGLLRSAEATKLLLGVVDEGPLPAAAHALGALAIQRHDEDLVSQVRTIVASRRSRALDQAFELEFGG